VHHHRRDGAACHNARHARASWSRQARGCQGRKRIYFDADSTPLLLGSPSSGRTAWSSARPGRSASARLYPPIGCVTPTAHAIDRGASLPEVKSTLGHGDIATTSARPNTQAACTSILGLSSMKNRARESASGADRSRARGRFTPKADKQSMALLTHSSPGRREPIAAQHWPEHLVRDDLILCTRHHGSGDDTRKQPDRSQPRGPSPEA
jgi:hypothetical protein